MTHRRVPHDHLTEESMNILGPVDIARRAALVRESPPAEEPAESAAKNSQCERSHRLKERDEYTIRVTVAGGWPEVE